MENTTKGKVNPNILVIGSFMMDLVVRTPRAPKNGETIIGDSFNRFPGGKGANQAVAASRLGADVTIVGKLGQDSFGNEMLEAIRSNHINTKYVLRDNHYPTGVGLITLDYSGNNRIVVVPGANTQFTKTNLRSVGHVMKSADFIVLQLEMDVDMVEEAVILAKEKGIPVLLNPAPATEISLKLLSNVTYLTPNESEAEYLTGVYIADVDDAERAANILLNKGVKHVIITLGEKGAVVVNELGVDYVPSFTVKPIDTVAAGDAFNGAISVALAKGESLVDAVKFANGAGALAVMKEGAIPSIPYLKEVYKFIEENEWQRIRKPENS